MDICWIRHGKTRSNEEHRYLGRGQEPLSETGRRELCKMCRVKEVEILFSSPMRRCVESAELLFGRAPIPMEGWEEMDFGRFEGKTYEELQDDSDYQRWLESNGTMPFPEGESREHFQERCMVGFHRMMGRLVETKGDFQSRQSVKAACVVHGGTIMAILSKLTGKEYFDFQVPNGAGYRTVLEYRQGEVRLLEIQRLDI